MNTQPAFQNYQSIVLELLDKWARQRSGLEFCNYGDVSAYRSEQRSITRDLQDFRALLAAVDWRSFTPEQWRDAFRAYSGRLSLIEENGLPVRLEYCAGQYFPTEYRKAACAVLSSLLWGNARDNMPKPDGYQVRPFRQWQDNQFVRAHESQNFKTFTAAINYQASIGGQSAAVIHEAYNGKPAGDYIRDKFEKDFGRGIASRWFN